ncbi:hypothetical protein FIBSPDRAFT_296641 [Athelia psychrophila]|uniref:Uncharacterized protein n=1 Tax=Athelia psychrophila TaxID=1759441 RepID=A0A167XAS5_9AGAM|nr:hypothetical protein FIBSPDRAFT_296641 [Fibularhizoctonia sp. CBS 109695]
MSSEPSSAADLISLMTSSVSGMWARSETMFATPRISCKLAARSQTAASWSTWLLMAYSSSQTREPPA